MKESMDSYGHALTEFREHRTKVFVQGTHDNLSAGISSV